MKLQNKVVCMTLSALSAPGRRMKSVSERLTIAGVAIALLILIVLSWYYLVYEESYSVCAWQKEEDSTKAIPKVVHRIWFQSRQFPDKYSRNWKHCKQLNPDYTFMLWSDEDIRAFMMKEYPWMIPIYEKYPYFVLQTDMARYALIYHYGGIYIDLDLDCNIGFDTMVANVTKGKDYGVVLGAGRPVGIGNSFLAAKAKHPFFKVMIDNLIHHQGFYFTPYWTVMLSAGTLYVAKMYLKYPCRNEITVISASLHNDVYLSHQHDSSWHKTDGKIIIWMGGHLYLTFFLVALGISAIVIFCVRRRRNSRNLNIDKRSGRV